MGSRFLSSSKVEINFGSVVRLGFIDILAKIIQLLQLYPRFRYALSGLCWRNS